MCICHRCIAGIYYLLQVLKAIYFTAKYVHGSTLCTYHTQTLWCLVQSMLLKINSCSLYHFSCDLFVFGVLTYTLFLR